MKLENYINRIKVNRQYAKSTIDSYTRILKSFDSYIVKISLWKRSIADSEKIKLYDIESWVWLEKLKGKTARTCNWYLVCIRDFLQYCERCHEKVLNYREILLMKEPPKKVDALSELDAERLLQYMKADMSKDELTKTRDYAIVSVLIHTWLRVSELCNLKVDDVKNELQIIGKNHSLRLVYLFQEHITLLRLYLFMREGKHIESEYLFCSHANNSKWKQISRVAVEKIVREAGIKAWISDPVWPHKLRHTFATNLLRRWWNIYYIKELLGHASVSTTQTYLTATNNDLRRTQSLLQRPAPEEFNEERLMPMPESFVFKDRGLFDAFMRSCQTPNYHNWIPSDYNISQRPTYYH